jgi:hypothetical protein
MGERRTWEVTTTHRVTVDTESWHAAYGVDPADRDAFGRDVAGWVREQAYQALALASDVDGTVTAQIVTEPHEVS